MAKYKLWLTIKNNDGSTKEICAGDVDLSLDNLTDEQAKQLADRLDPHLITEEEYDNTTLKYTDFELKEEPKEE
jgi:hypothetical protein